MWNGKFNLGQKVLLTGSTSAGIVLQITQKIDEAPIYHVAPLSSDGEEQRFLALGFFEDALTAYVAPPEGSETGEPDVFDKDEPRSIAADETQQLDDLQRALVVGDDHAFTADPTLFGEPEPAPVTFDDPEFVDNSTAASFQQLEQQMKPIV